MAIQGGRPTDGRVVPFLFVRNGEQALGHVWALSTVKETLTPSQIDERVQAMLAGASEK